MLANIVEKWCLRGWYKNQKIPDLCGGAEQLLKIRKFQIYVGVLNSYIKLTPPRSQPAAKGITV
ncbi:hypothetical protein [Endozoicomonas sp. SCSIO W0465]|uniref:hypothetical protein n=1 Tax=Endozoicomonas sp. SCSIO W0465 TaxID=2918516 RepID=UPI002076104B|nr:hypothetical protein [Endozoicomonas sp. SCSIO W0465]USE37253.1 hypothetical protein MJO57_03205 [Endozoicomonas sp. SCSIO W0465]